jgi:hypothetical protein
MFGDRLKILRNAMDGSMTKEVGRDLSKAVVKRRETRKRM